MRTLCDRLSPVVERLQGATIAIVYAHTFDNHLLAKHYLRQRTETLTGYADVVDLLGAYPVFFNIEQFVELASSPEKYRRIDHVINVPGGSLDLSNLLLPAVLATKMSKAIFPASASTIALGQNKPVASRLAEGLRWSVPQEWDNAKSICKDVELLIKPRCAGDSHGVRRFDPNDLGRNTVRPDEFLQEFVKGYDLTSYIFLDPMSLQLKVIHSSVTLPNDPTNEDWFWDERTKSASSGRGIGRFTKNEVTRLSAQTTPEFDRACTDLAQVLGVTTLARVDTRLTRMPAESPPIDLDEARFLEINVLPSITPSGSWSKHLSSHFEKDGIRLSEIHPLFDVLPPMQYAMLFFLLTWIAHSGEAPTTGVDQLK